MTRRLMILIVALIVGLAAPAWAGLDEGMAAYERGDYEAALREWRPLAEQGNADAQNNLGTLYRHGEGVEQDYGEAVRWYRKAAEQGNAEAQASLGNMYGEGRGVIQDYAEAVTWYHKAAEQGGVPAQNNLGLMYANGRGVPQDYVRAHMWLNLAAAQGNEKARKSRDIVEKRINPEQLAEAQRLAREWKPKQ